VVSIHWSCVDGLMLIVMTLYLTLGACARGTIVVLRVLDLLIWHTRGTITQFRAIGTGMHSCGYSLMAIAQLQRGEDFAQ
jgi:hypothetical protein